MNGLVQHAHGVVQGVVSKVHRKIHHVEVEVFGKMGIVVNRLVDQ